MRPFDRSPAYAAIDARLAGIVAASPNLPAWHQDWMRLRPQSPDEERLAVYRAIRDSGCLPDEAGFYLVAWQIDAMTRPEAETDLRHFEERLHAIQRAHGLGEDDAWVVGQTPVEYQTVQHQYFDAWDEIYVRKLAECGEQEMAALFVADRDAFERRNGLGREFFYGPADPEAWLDDLAEAVAGNMEAVSAPGPLGFRHREEDGFWVVMIYPKSVELVGGADDGEVVAPAFSLDLEGLRSIFERVDDFTWLSLGFPLGDGPHVSIEGVYQGHEVYVQILAYAPEDEEPGMKVPTRRRGD
jgi:hypothetical protein